MTGAAMDEVKNPLPIVDTEEEIPETMEEELKDAKGDGDE